jgi:hypothetical protein
MMKFHTFSLFDSLRVSDIHPDVSMRSVSYPCHFTPREKALDTLSIEGWVGNSAGLEVTV